jgi:hypothetical protein
VQRAPGAKVHQIGDSLPNRHLPEHYQMIILRS